MNLTCDCCGFTAEFVDLEAAFQTGWDAPPHFTGYVACNLCPGSMVVLGQTAKHASVHARWEREGRPMVFDQETCLAPEDRVPEDVLRRLTEALEALKHDG